MAVDTPVVRFKNDQGNDFPAWETMELGAIAEIKLGKMLDKTKHTSGSLLPYLNNISLRWNEVNTSNLPQMFFKDNELERFGLKAGDVVVCEGGEPGRSAVWDGRLPDLKFQKAIHRVRFTLPFQSLLLVLYLERIVGTNRFEKLFTGGGIKHLTKETFSLLKVPVASHPEQLKIADFLTAIDTRIGQLNQKKALLEDYKKGVMQQLFSQAIRFKDDDGNEYPDWEERKLGDVASIKSASRVHKNEWSEHGVPFFRSSDVVSHFKGNKNKKAFISRELFDELSTKSGRLKKHDLLVTGGGSIGIPYLVPNDAPMYFKDADLLWFERTEQIHSYFLYSYLSTAIFRKYLASVTHIGTIAHYTIEQAKSTPAALPTILEQSKIANFLFAIDEKINGVDSQIAETKVFKKGLLQQMFV